MVYSSIYFEKPPESSVRSVTIRMPDLQSGNTYSFDEVKNYVFQEDWNRLLVGFPTSIQHWPQTDPLQYRQDQDVFLQYAELPTTRLEKQVQELSKVFAKQDVEQERVCTIVSLLEAGEQIFPVLIQKNDPQLRICEGMHRSVALWLLKSPIIPVFFAKYSDW